MVISNRAGHEKENKNELKKNKGKLVYFRKYSHIWVYSSQDAFFFLAGSALIMAS